MKRCSPLSPVHHLLVLFGLVVASSCASSPPVCEGPDCGDSVKPDFPVYRGTCQASPEICDGLDNDCDGFVDDGLDNCDPCSHPQHELPVVTHWSENRPGFQYLASDAAHPFLDYDRQTPYEEGACYPMYRTGFPEHERYVGDTYAVAQIDNQTATSFFKGLCRETGVPFRLLRPNAFFGRGAGVSRLADGRGGVQVLHAKLEGHSLFTVLLPPNWSSNAKERTYPIVANGFYDLNESLFRHEGHRMAKAVAASGTGGRSGAIGILWNGGGALASRTMDRSAFTDFEGIVNWVQTELGGDAHRIFMWGGSRGGYTSIAMASNPYNLNYRVVFAGAVAAPTHIGGAAQMQSTTFPGLVHAVSWSTGLGDAWRTGWKYPSCAGKPELTGLSGPQAHTMILAGTGDLEEADRFFSPSSQQFLDGLKRAKTRLAFYVTQQDNIVPYMYQLEYAHTLLDQGFPVEVEVLIRAGHEARRERGLLGEELANFNRLLEALLPEVAPGAPPADTSTGISYFRVNRAKGRLEPFVPEDGLEPISMDAPYRVVRGMRVPIVFAGEPETEYDFTITYGDTVVLRRTGHISSRHHTTEWIDVGPHSALGKYTYGLRVRKPGQDWKTIPSTNTPTGDLATVQVYAEEPNISGMELLPYLKGPVLPSFRETNWGLSEY